MGHRMQYAPPTTGNSLLIYALFTSSDLPPTAIARPLPVLKTTNVHTAKKSSAADELPLETRRKHARPKKNALSGDDTPRAFIRLMNFQTKGWKLPKGLDDGAPISKKRKRKTDDQEQPAVNTAVSSVPKILPSERLSDFSSRVNAAIPVARLAKKSKRGSALVEGLRERQTKTEKRMQKMQAEWREVEARRKEKLAEEEDEAMEGDEVGIMNGGGLRASKKKGKAKHKSRNGLATSAGNEAANGDDDPWAPVAAKRMEKSNTSASSGGLVGLHDVVLAPPKLSKVPRENLKAANAPTKPTMGLKRQEELGEARRKVIEGYRRMMSERRGEQ